MKVFLTLTKAYAILGISSSSQSNQKIFMGFSLWAWMMISHVMYIFYVASAYMEYMESVCMTTGSIIVFVCYADIVFKSHTIFDVFDKIENFIESSERIFELLYLEWKFPNFWWKCIPSGREYRESKIFFKKVTKQIERLSEITFYLNMKVILPIEVLPKCIFSFAAYLINDSGADSFQLPFPFW